MLPLPDDEFNIADWADLLLSKPAWHSDANCKDRTDGVTFFPDKGQPTAPAKAICERCMVTAECLAAAVGGLEVGVWGGTSGKERRAPGQRPEALGFNATRAELTVRNL